MFKIQEELKEAKNPFVKVLANHLIANAEKDPLIAQSLNKENKSLKGAWSYIKSKAQKKATDGVAMIDDQTVYGWAQHYFDEDSLDFEPKKKGDNTSNKKEEVINLPEEDEDVFDF